MNASGQIAIKGSNASSFRTTRLLSEESHVDMGSNKRYKMDISVALNDSVKPPGTDKRTTNGVSMEWFKQGASVCC
jgi:hypothetical protein